MFAFKGIALTGFDKPQTIADRQQATADTRPRTADRQQTERRQTAHKKLKTFNF
jgi:hypothetical protein